jgi:hypothetical protein
MYAVSVIAIQPNAPAKQRGVVAYALSDTGMTFNLPRGS